MNIEDIKIREFIKGRRFGAPALVALGAALYFLAGLIIILASRGDLMVLGMQGLAFVLPFYFVASIIFPKVNHFGFVVLFIISGYFYTLVIYQLALWTQEIISKLKNRPKFVLKKVQAIN